MFETVQFVSGGQFIARDVWKHACRVIDSNELIVMLDGTAYMAEDGIEYVLQKNDVLWLEPGREHYGYRFSENVSFYWLHWVGGPAFSSARKQQTVAHPASLSLLFGQLLHYVQDNRDREALDYVTRLILMEWDSAGEESDQNRIVNRMAAWIRANHDLTLRVSDVAAHFGYNADYASRLFRRTFGQNLKSYIDDSKIEWIKQYLLTGNMTLAQVAAACGFSEYKYFLKFFVYHTGMTPTEFCNTYSKSHINHQ